MTCSSYNYAYTNPIIKTNLTQSKNIMIDLTCVSYNNNQNFFGLLVFWFQITIIQMEKKDFQNRYCGKKIKKRLNGARKYKISDLIQELKVRGNLSREVTEKMMRQSSLILQNEPTMLKLASPLVVVGDIHGQFFDLVNIFQKFGSPSQVHYLFLGDYVDRGKFCIEVMSLILALKINYPENIHLLRGNHEGRTMTTFFNFKIECQKKFNSEIYQNFIALFMRLPLCALIDSKYLAVHGGISPSIKLLDEIEKINRFVEIPDHGALCDLLWSDPSDEKSQNWVNNKMRSCSYYYSQIQATRFLKANKVKMILRGHQVQMKGFKYQYGPNNEPLTLTIFSAPKYCDTYKNKGAIVVITAKELEIHTFKDVEHPFILSNYLNAFELSFPLIGVGVAKMFTHILKNQKVKKSLKPNDEAEITQIINKLQEVKKINDVLTINADQINILLTTGNAIQSKDDQISQNLMEFIQLKCSQLNEKMPLIFGPKSLEFVKIRVNNKEQIQPQDEGL